MDKSEKMVGRPSVNTPTRIAFKWAVPKSSSGFEKRTSEGSGPAAKGASSNPSIRLAHRL